MEIRMPDGSVLATDNKEVIEAYINKMGGVEVADKKPKKSATKVAPALEAE